MFSPESEPGALSLTWLVFTLSNPSPWEGGSCLGSPKLREKLRGEGAFMLWTGIRLCSAALTPRFIFTSSPPLRPPPRAAPPVGRPMASAGYVPGREPAMTHLRARGRLTPTWLGRDGVRKQLQVPGSHASQRCGSFNHSECVYSSPAATSSAFPSFSWQPFTHFHTYLVKPAIRITDIFCSFEPCNRIKTWWLCRWSCLYLLLPLPTPRQLFRALTLCRHPNAFSTLQLWLPPLVAIVNQVHFITHNYHTNMPLCNLK